MTKAELIAALKASKMTQPGDTVYVYDMDNGMRHQITKLDDSCGVLDLNCNDADHTDED